MGEPSKGRFVVALMAVLTLVFVLGACARQAAKPAPAATQAPAAVPAKETPRAQATVVPQARVEPTKEAPKPAAPAPAAPKSEFKTPEELIPRGMAQAHPLVAKYHWSRLPNPKDAKPKYGGVLHVDLRYDPSNWDPFTGNTGTYVWGNVVYNTLVRANMRLTDAFKGKDNLRQLVAECDVCESWKQTGPTQYTFKIRPEVRWQNVPPLNGRPLTAEDIKYSYDKYLDPKAFQQWGIFQSVESIQAPDKGTLVINLKFPHAGFVDAITHPAFYIFSREGFEKEGGLIAPPPLGSGFMLFEQHVPQNRLYFKRNPNYWKKDEFGQQLPYLDRIELTFMPDVATQVAAYRTKRIDTLINFSWDLVEDILRTEKPGETSYLRVMEMNTGGTNTWQMQLRKPPFNDVRVRRALSMALDRQAIIKQAYGEGYCTPGPIPTWWMGLEYPPACAELGPWHQYNPTRARELLKEAGYDEKNPLTFDLNGGGPGGGVIPANLAQLESAVEYWKAVGVKANIRQRETTVHQRLNRSGEFEGIMGVTGVGIGTDLDAFAFKVHSKGPENFSGINDPVLDKLVEAQRGEFDLQKRRALGKQIAERLWDQVSLLNVANFYFAEWTRPYMQNWVTHDLYYFIHGWGAFAVEYTWYDK
ncbi:MAG: ABC transporter substrate-binding protein [Chloroflexi bacterium]|nr:ABC transporter substrate-binding protein [Chloroflexota bacterium]